MRYQQGMTLIEALVALVLLSLLSIGLFTSFRYGQRTYAQLSRVDLQTRDVLAAQRLLRNVVESAYPFDSKADPPHFGVEGSGDELNITANSPGYSQLGFYRYRLYTTRRADGLEDLMVDYAIDRSGGPTVDVVAMTSERQQEKLLEKIKGLEFAYLPRVKPNTVQLNDTSWQSTWQQRSNPGLIKVQVRFPSGDQRQWPELIASPKVTDSASCEFDVVSQACRGVLQ